MKCITSLLDSDYKNHLIIFVDNGSSDGSVTCIKEKFPQVIVLENSSNLGYAGGNNVGIKWAMLNGAEYIHLINNDAVIDSLAITSMMRILDNDPSIGLIGPKVMFFDEPKLIWSFGGQIDWFNLKGMGTRHQFYKYDISTGDLRGLTLSVDYVPGCSMIVKNQVVREVGLFDEDFFAYREDLDWAYRIRKLGYRVVVFSDATVWHKVSSTSEGVKNPYVYYLQSRNNLLFHHKNDKKIIWMLYCIVYTLLIMPLELLTLIARSISNHTSRNLVSLIFAYLIGVAHFLLGKFGYQKIKFS